MFLVTSSGVQAELVAQWQPPPWEIHIRASAIFFWPELNCRGVQSHELYVSLGTAGCDLEPPAGVNSVASVGYFFHCRPHDLPFHRP